MNSLAKWVWIILLAILFVGVDIFWYLGAGILVGLLVWWLKPEWLDKM